MKSIIWVQFTKNLNHLLSVFLIYQHPHLANIVNFTFNINLISLFLYSDSKQQNIQSRSNVSSPQQSSPLPHRTSPINNKKKSSSKSLFNKSPTSSTHQKKTIDAKTVKSTTSINYEFRVQTSNESPLAGTTDPVFIEIINTKGNSIKIPLNNSINNSKPFQKGQLDVFHLNIPKDFHAVNKN